MLKAFQYGKIKSETKEDSLTASVFQLLSYLPVTMLVDILIKSIYGNSFSKDTGALLSLTFWDKWRMKEEDNNSKFVEPDVFLSFEKLNLIVEAKRWDDKQQSEEQWTTELQGYFNEYPKEEETKPVYLLALGGLHSEENVFLKINEENVTILKSRWSKLLNTIVNQKKALANLETPTPFQISQLNVLEDLVVSFELHGFFAGTWLTDETGFFKLMPSSTITQSFIKNQTLWLPTK